MKRFYSTIIALVATVSMMAQGWPSNYGGVMLQGFSWDSYVDTQWSNLESQADELSQYFNLIWVPQSGNCNTSHNVMGYTPVYYFNQNSSFGTEAQLRSMIKAFKNKGTGIVADVVVNHRNNLGVGGSWVDYPAETYNGVTYQMRSTDIVANDDGGQTKTWATANGYSLSSNNDEGEGWSGCRDLDHKSENVQKVIKAYVKYLVDDLGYTGFRYDMVKGFNGSHVADYNDAAGVAYSVGECWDSNSTIKNWINATGKKSAAFDFQFRYNVRDAINANDWSKLNSTNNLVHDASYRQWAVTFVENHDTQYRSASEQLDPIRKDTLAANAYLLAMPGTPCVFLPHWKAYKSEIKSMIDVRHAAGITNTSTYTNISPGPTLYRNTVTGTKGKLLVCLGNRAGASSALGGYTNVLSGYHYAYLLDNSLETAFADKSSGTYETTIPVKLSAVSATSGAKLVYTTNGSTPTASSPSVASGQTVNITSSCTLTVGLLKNGSVSGIVTREYTIKPFEAHTATVYFKDPGWSAVYFYAWDSKGTLNGSWPGKTVTDTKTIKGAKWYYRTFDINASNYTFNIIFGQGNGKKQTVDIGPISDDRYYELAGEINGKFTVADITSNITTGIDGTMADNAVKRADNAYYTLQGMKLAGRPSVPGIYIHNGKKTVVR